VLIMTLHLVLITDKGVSCQCINYICLHICLCILIKVFPSIHIQHICIQ